MPLRFPPVSRKLKSAQTKGDQGRFVLKGEMYMESKFGANGKTNEKELSKLTKAKAVPMRLDGRSFLEISILLNCDEDAIEEYLTGLKLTEETMKLLYNRKVPSEQISQKCDIPINVVNSWRNIIATNRQKRRAEHKADHKLAVKEMIKKADDGRAKFLESVKVKSQELVSQRKQGTITSKENQYSDIPKAKQGQER